MGIPKYFRWITNKHSELIIDPQVDNTSYSLEIDDDVLNDISNIDNLFLDANCLIHPCCRTITGDEKNRSLIKKHFEDYKLDKNGIKSNYSIFSKLEKTMFEEIVRYIKYLADFVKPKKLLYIAIDGVAPRAKMEQQRTRRYRSHKEREMRDNIYIKYNKTLELYWDTNCITPGSTFMIKLSNYLQKNLKNNIDNSLKIQLSDTHRPGEGEHKIMDYLRSNMNKDISCIYGLDADLIMLALCLEEKTYLLREAVQFGKIDCDHLLYFAIPKFKEILCDEIINEIGEVDFEIDKQGIAIDYVFLCFLLGNDFLPHLVNLDITEGSINELLKIYIKLFSIRKHNIIQNTKIVYSFLQQILNHLYNSEDSTLKFIQKRIDSRRIYKKHYSTPLERELNMIKYYPIFNKDHRLKLGGKNWRDIYYKYYFHINNVQKSKTDVDLICRKYVEGLQWNIKYYIEGCCSWKWYYPYKAAPCLREICQYLNNRIYETDFGKTEPYTPLEQLTLVLPKHSKDLLPEVIANLLNSNTPGITEYYPDNFILDRLNHIWLHECAPIIPILNDKIVLNKVSTLKLNAYEEIKNKISKTDIYINIPDSSQKQNISIKKAARNVFITIV